MSDQIANDTNRTSEPFSVCVYCGSSGHVKTEYLDLAREIGAALARHGTQIIYGGGRIGMMGMLADGALEAGGRVVGIIPEYIRAREIQHLGLTEMHVVDSMHTRKRMMVERANAFLVLPGGFGTLDETFEALTWRYLGLHNYNIVFYDYAGFWQPLLGCIEHLITTGFVPTYQREYYDVVNNLDDMFVAIKAVPAAPHDPMSKWG